MAPRLSGPTGIRSMRSASNADSSSERCRFLAGAAGEQNVDGLFAHPPQRKRQRARRRRVEPLDVVDSKHDRRLGSESLQCASDCNAERARIEASSRVLEQECHLERAPPRRRQLRQDSLEHVVEQVAEAGVSEPSLQLGRPRHEDARLRAHARPRRPPARWSTFRSRPRPRAPMPTVSRGLGRGMRGRSRAPHLCRSIAPDISAHDRDRVILRLS